MQSPAFMKRDTYGSVTIYNTHHTRGDGGLQSGCAKEISTQVLVLRLSPFEVQEEL